MAIWRRRADPVPAVSAVPAVLDPLLGLPGAADLLASDFAFVPTGQFSICFRPIEAGAFRDVEYDVRDWLNRDAGETASAEIAEDSFGFTWISIRRPPGRFQFAAWDLHAASSMFADGGFGAQLLCSMTSFRDRGERHVALVYLYKRGTFYPFVPQSGNTRNTALELTFKGALEGKLPIEEDLHHWYPVWDAPGL